MTTKSFGAFLKRNSLIPTPISFSAVATVIGIDKRKRYDWHKNHLSDFTLDRVQKSLHENDIPLPPREVTKEKEKIDVPILKAEHIGEHMAVDEKSINGKTGKIALMASTTTKNGPLNHAMCKFEDARFKVKILTIEVAS
jgi:hypothetical protein